MFPDSCSKQRAKKALLNSSKYLNFKLSLGNETEHLPDVGAGTWVVNLWLYLKWNNQKWLELLGDWDAEITGTLWQSQEAYRLRKEDPTWNIS